MHRRIEEDRNIAFTKVLAMQRIGAQGYPTTATIKEAYAAARSDAIDGVQEFGRWILPWEKWKSREEMQKSEEETLRSEAQPLIEAWIRRYEPENVEVYRAQGVI